MGGHSANLQYLTERYPHAKVLRWTTHLNCMRKAAEQSRTRSFWLIGTCCDYTDFDFLWEPVPWEEYQIHCWASGEQKLGDTFLGPTSKFLEQQPGRIDLYQDVNYHRQGVARLPWQKVRYSSPNLVKEIRSTSIETPYALFTHETNNEIGHYDPALWSPEVKNIVSLSTANSQTLVPREAGAQLNEQIYDYEHLLTFDQIEDPCQDIIFISYDETNADENWGKLHQRFPKARRLHGVEGMENALREAARMSTTDWYYAVFAKTELHPDFKFDFLPDYWQDPKHYIFHAENPMNGLVYGHMGVILYNCDIVKGAKQFGIDYTMSARHTVVSEISAIARFNSNPYQTWRTAFREAGKLAQFCDEKANIENEYRLRIWLRKAEGEYSEWCLQGARDGYLFYKTNKDNQKELQNAFNWKWLRQYFTEMYNDVEHPNLTVLQQRQESWQPQ